MQEGTRLSHIASQTTAPSNLSTATAMTNETNIRTEENPLYTLPEAVMLQAAYAGHAFVHFAPEEDRANARKIVEQVSEAAGIVTVSANSEAEEVAKLKMAEMDIDPEVLAAIPSHLRDQLANAKTFAEFEAAIGPFQKARDAAVELVTKERQHEIHEKEERQAKHKALMEDIEKAEKKIAKVMDEHGKYFSEEEKNRLQYFADERDKYPKGSAEWLEWEKKRLAYFNDIAPEVADRAHDAEDPEAAKNIQSATPIVANATDDIDAFLKDEPAADKKASAQLEAEKIDYKAEDISNEQSGALPAPVLQVADNKKAPATISV